jgi:hypothetical protein
MKTRFFITLALLLSMLLLTIPVSSRADQMYEYTYTSGPFTSDGGPDFPLPPSSYSLTISFTYGAITGAHDGQNLAGLVSNFTISDGPLTFTTANKIEFGLPGPYGISPAPGFLPDGSWIVLSYGSSEYLTGTNAFTMLAESVYPYGPISIWPNNFAGDTSEQAAVYGPTDYGYNMDEGTWTATPIPEPASIILLVLGCLALAPVMRSVQSKRGHLA